MIKKAFLVCFASRRTNHENSPYGNDYLWKIFAKKKMINNFIDELHVGI